MWLLTTRSATSCGTGTEEQAQAAPYSAEECEGS